MQQGPTAMYTPEFSDNMPLQPGENAVVWANTVTATLQPWWGNTGQHSESDNDIEATLTAIRQQTPFTHGQGGLGMGQINPTPGDVAGNAQQIQRLLAIAEALQLNMVVFPELALMGYPINDAIVRFPAIVDHQLAVLANLAKATGETAALIGFVEPVPTIPQGTRAPYYNALAICHRGEILGVVRKNLLPAYNEYHDPRTFRSANPADPPIVPWQHGLEIEAVTDWEGTINGMPIGVAICYDWWHEPETHGVQACPIARWLKHYPNTKLLINASASPSRTGKLATRHTMFQRLAQHYGLPLVYVNQAGAIDEHIFDGASSVISATGAWIARSPAFKPALTIVNPLQDLGLIEPHPETQPNQPALLLPMPEGFDPTHASDLPRTYTAIVTGIREYFAKTGFQRAVLGLSGGLDSAITAALAVDALGSENVMGVLMPSEHSSTQSREDALQLAQQLGMATIELPITELTDAATHQRLAANQALQTHWGQANDSFAADNQQAMSRAMLLRLLGNEYNALPLATSDKSELYLGYATVNGDMSGALAPMGDVVKTKVRALGHWLNRNEERIPLSVLEKPSGAELAIDPATGKHLTAEDALMPYLFADEVIWRIEHRQEWPIAMLDSPFVYEQTHTLTREQKQVWLERFLHRLQRAVFKWWVAPPILIVDGNGGLAHADYRHAITCKLQAP